MENNNNAQDKQGALPGSIDYQINLEKTKSLLPQQPKQELTVSTKKPKPLVGIYILAFLLIANSTYALTKVSGSSDAAKMVKMFSTLGILAGLGLIAKNNLARIFTLSLCYLGAVLSLVSLNLISMFVYVSLIIYLNLPNVKDEF